MLGKHGPLEGTRVAIVREPESEHHFGRAMRIAMPAMAVGFVCQYARRLRP